MILTEIKIMNRAFNNDWFIHNLSIQSPKTLLRFDLTSDCDLATILLLGFFTNTFDFNVADSNKIEEGLRVLSRPAHDALMFAIADEVNKCLDNLIKP